MRTVGTNFQSNLCINNITMALIILLLISNLIISSRRGGRMNSRARIYKSIIFLEKFSKNRMYFNSSNNINQGNTIIS